MMHNDTDIVNSELASWHSVPSEIRQNPPQRLVKKKKKKKEGVCLVSHTPLTCCCHCHRAKNIYISLYT